MAAEFETPTFLLNLNEDAIHEKMKKILPSDLDISEGGHGWNLTRPTALVIAEICEFILPEVVRVISPDFSYGDFLVGHAKNRSMEKRAATPASGEITITGEANTVIPAGSLFSTAAINNEPSVDYYTLASATIPASGSITVDIECVNAGIVGNTTANTVILVSSKLNGITAVTNKKAISGGTNEESDESLIARIAEYDQSLGESFIGNPADYKRWAKSVDGVGEATVLPASDDSGIVTIILTDANGDPATDELITKVYNKIMSPAEPLSRLAPCGAILSVLAPSTIAIGIQATVELESGASLDTIKANFAALLGEYLPIALDEGEVKYSQIWAVLASVEGVSDFKDLRIGIKAGSGITYSTENIPVADNQLPSIDPTDLLLTSGTV